MLRYFLSRLMLAQGTFLTYYLSWVTLTNLNHFSEIIGPLFLRIIRISHWLGLYLIFPMFWFHSRDLVLLNCIHLLPRHNDSSNSNHSDCYILSRVESHDRLKILCQSSQISSILGQNCFNTFFVKTQMFATFNGILVNK